MKLLNYVKMVAMLLDDRQQQKLYSICQMLNWIELTGPFSAAEPALQALKRQQACIVLLQDGPETASHLEAVRRLCPMAEIMMIAAGPDHAALAYEHEVLAYLPETYPAEQMVRCLRRAALLLKPARPRVFVRTFGRFDVFVEQEPIYFANAKAKEMLAVLVDHRGGVVTMDTMVTYLWEDRPYDEKVKQLYRKAVNYLNKLLEEWELDIFVSNRGCCYVKTPHFNCDLYDLLEGKPHAEDSFYGKYLFDYGWSETRTAELQALIDTRAKAKFSSR